MQEDWSQLEQLPTLLAEDMVATAPNLTKSDTLDIASAISEITYESQTAGPDLLTFTLFDPNWDIQRSGLCIPDSDGILPMVDINFPRGTNIYFRLAMVQNQGGDMTQANLQLTFQHRIVSYLQEDWGPLKVAPGTRTRAEFIKQLVDRIPGSIKNRTPDVLGQGNPDSQKIQFVCPQLKVIQSIAGGGTPVKNPTDTKNTHARVNKGAANEYTVTASFYTPDGLAGAGASHGFSLFSPGFHYAELSTTASASGAGDDFSALGNLPYGTKLNITGPNGVTVVANKCDVGGGGPGIGDHHRCVDLYTQELADKLGVNGLGLVKISRTDGQPIGGDVGPATGSSGTEPSTTDSSGASGQSDVSQLARGSDNNPDEDSWTCMQRLATEVNWLCYTSIGPPGNRGNYLYYITGPRNDLQLPVATIEKSSTAGEWDIKPQGKKGRKVQNVLQQDPSYTVDNTAFQYKTTKKKHGKIQRKNRIVLPQSPTEVALQLVTEPLAFQAGEVIELGHAGAVDGNWIITDSTRNLLGDFYDQITLDPPSAPTAEPAAQTSGSAKGSKGGSANQGGVTITGNNLLDRVVQAAQKAHSYGAGSASTRYAYDQERPFPLHLFGPGNLSTGHLGMDCSAFCIMCYYAAGATPAQDPGGEHFSGNGYTGSIAAYCESISASAAVPGDIVLFGSPPGFDHGVIYAGNGQCYSQGGPGSSFSDPWGPLLTSVAVEASYHGSGAYYYRLKGL